MFSLTSIIFLTTCGIIKKYDKNPEMPYGKDECKKIRVIYF